MCVPEADGSDQLMNDGGDATLLVHKGKELEVMFPIGEPTRSSVALGCSLGSSRGKGP